MPTRVDEQDPEQEKRLLLGFGALAKALDYPYHLRERSAAREI